MDPRWRQLRLLHRLVMGLWLGWLPCGLLVMATREGTALGTGMYVAGGLYFAAFMLCSAIFSLWPCPNCGHIFIGLRFLPYNLFNPRCANCRAQIGDAITGPTPTKVA